MTSLENYETNKAKNAAYRRAIEDPEADKRCGVCNAVYKNKRWVKNYLKCENCGIEYQ